MKICPKCQRELPRSEFYKDCGRKDGFDGWCKECRTAYYHTPVGREVKRRKNLKHRYGLSSAEYEALLESQGGTCALCGKVDRRRLSVDHSHKTGEIRALLCSRCNTFLGLAGEDPALLCRAAAYLVEHDA